MVFSVISWDFNPEIFSIGNHGVRWYGLMIALALFAGYMIFKRYLRGDKLTPEMVDSLLVHIALASIIGARLGHCFFYEPEYFLKNPLEILKIWKGGLASHGWAIGILLALWLYYRKYKIPFLWLMDRIVIVVALGAAFIRIFLPLCPGVWSLLEIDCTIVPLVLYYQLYQGIQRSFMKH